VDAIIYPNGGPEAAAIDQQVQDATQSAPYYVSIDYDASTNTTEFTIVTPQQQ